MEAPLLHTSGLMIGYQTGKRAVKAVSGPLNLNLYARY